jgi:hypothetical protein
MKFTLTIEYPNNPELSRDTIEEMIMEELSLDITDEIACGKREGRVGHRSPDYPGHLSGRRLRELGIEPKGTWKLEIEE